MGLWEILLHENLSNIRYLNADVINELFSFDFLESDTNQIYVIVIRDEGMGNRTPRETFHRIRSATRSNMQEDKMRRWKVVHTCAECVDRIRLTKGPRTKGCVWTFMPVPININKRQICPSTWWISCNFVLYFRWLHQPTWYRHIAKIPH